MSFEQQSPGGQQPPYGSQPQPGQPSPYGGYGPLPATGSTTAGMTPKKGPSAGLWIGIGAAVLAAILLTVFGLSMVKRGGGDNGSAAGGTATTETAPSGDSSSSAADGAPAASTPEEAVTSYYAALKDGKAQQAIKLLNTEYTSTFDPTAPQFKDEVYSKAANRPESFDSSGVEKIGDTMAKVSGTVKQNGRDLPVTMTLDKVGGVWKISPSYRSVSVPTIKGGSNAFALTVNGAALPQDTYSLSGALPGDYVFSGPNTDYFTSTDVTKTVWADGGAEAAGTASSVVVTPTAKATTAAEKAVQDALVTCAKKQDVTTCGSEFKVKGLDFTLTDLAVKVKEKPTLTVKPSSYNASSFDVKTATPGVISYDYKADGVPESQDKELSVTGTVDLTADGKVKELKLY